MTMFTGAGITFFRAAAVVTSLKMEIKGRELGMRSRMFKLAWPRLRAELGLNPQSKMTVKNLQLTLAVAEQALKQARANVKEGDITE